jgi:hypothetical protein
VLAAPGTFDFTGIVGTYSALRLIGVLRGAAVATNDQALVTFNGDGGVHYGSEYDYGNAGNPLATESNDAVRAVLARFIAADSASAGNFSPVSVIFPDYAGGARQRSFLTDGGLQLGISGTQMNAYAGCGFWTQTAAIARITVFGSAAANFVAGSFLNLYGVT